MPEPAVSVGQVREASGYRPVAVRIRDFQPVEMPVHPEIVRDQALRCLGCGTPFCHGYGCPLANVIPELNELARQQRWQEALVLLLATNPFPEFTGRLCPAPCEAACVMGINEKPVMIRQTELAIIETGFARNYLRAEPPAHNGQTIAVIGSGPCGLSVAETLNKAGCRITVYERSAEIGGLLRYGIPDFKLEKKVVERRIELMKREGVRFETGVNVGKDISLKYLGDRFDAVCLSCGALTPRDLKVPGRGLAGINFAVDYLAAQNRTNSGEHAEPSLELDAAGKNVLVIGGGDTGADCLGTAIRQGAAGVCQLEILPEPPLTRPERTPWPMWPAIRRDSSSHQEGGTRHWGVSVTGFKGENGHVRRAECVRVKQCPGPDGRFEFVPCPGTGFELEADLVILALGYETPDRDRMIRHLQLECGGRALPQGAAGCFPALPGPVVSPATAGAYPDMIGAGQGYWTGVGNFFIAGDMRTGPSLVARAIADGIAAARAIVRHAAVQGPEKLSCAS